MLLIGHLRRPSRTTSAGRRRPVRIVGVLVGLGWLVLAAAVVALWPASLGGASTIVWVAGNSMVPTYADRDLLLARHGGGYTVGDVVVFNVPGDGPGAGMRIVHRIVAAEDTPGGVLYTTRGDAREAVDQWQIHDADVLGRVTLHLTGSGRLMTLLGDPRALAGAGAVLVTLLLLPGRPPPAGPRAGTSECSGKCPDACPGADDDSGAASPEVPPPAGKSPGSPR